MDALISIRNIYFLLGALILLQGCASTDELFAEYDDQFCAAPEHPSRALSLKPAVFIDSDSPTVKETAPLVWEPAVYFDTDSSTVKKTSLPRLQANVETLGKFTDYKISLKGFTDPQGSNAYNELLSKRRVESVRELLIRDFGISADRIIRPLSGESSPSGSGDGGPVAADRRVDMTLLDASLVPVASQLLIRADSSPALKQP